MADQLARVRPGDLIRADDYNQLITMVNDLSVRLERLEAGGGPITGAPVILAVNPISPRIGDTVVVTGQGFDFTVGAARVAVDGLNATLLAGSTDTVLVFQLPGLAGVPEGGRPAQLVVSNLQHSVSRSVLVLPTLPLLQGDVSIQFQDTMPARIMLNQQCVFQFKLISGANLPVTLTLTPTVSVPAWQAGLQIVDDAGAVVPGRQVTVGALLTKDFFVRIPQITAAATTFTLMVTGQGPGMVASSGQQPFAVGQLGAQEKDIQLSIDAVIRGGGGGDPLSGSTITLKTNESAEVDLEAKFARIGIFDFTVEFVPSTSGWTKVEVPGPYQIEAGDIATGGENAGWAVRTPQPVIKAPPAAGTADLVLALQRQGATVKRTLMLRMVAEV